ncbi:hypothetical protein Ddye_031122 [Dipteronia dyeriana]|uniref:CCHC-type domain-containing protein n=1 Tax=Dipteronia dyeriana TaxID=168575 RepID=A0AAD9WND1_9ROSI|nr:hypothetical protein Ddye_031122 [Dipteronia dyeriana]
MSADYVAKLCAALTLKDKEEPLVPLQMDLNSDGEKRLGFHLVWKLFANKLVNREAFINLFSTIWRTLKSFDKALLVLKELVGTEDVKMMAFNKVAFWVQIHNAPLLCMIAVIGRFLGSMIGEVIEIDEGKSGDCVGKFIHVRVIIDVSKLLHRILQVDVLRDDTESTMLLRYERLPEHCFRCGCKGHVVRDCLEKAEGEEDYELLYGTWLKADSSKKRDQFRKTCSDQRMNEGHDRSGVTGGRPAPVWVPSKGGNRDVKDGSKELVVQEKVHGMDTMGMDPDLTRDLVNKVYSGSK